MSYSHVRVAEVPFRIEFDSSITVTDPNAEHGKITGTAMAGIFDKSPWETPFSIACRLLRLYSENIDDKPAVKAGKVLEKKIISFIDGIPAADIFGDVQKGGHEQWPSDFEDPIFGGHIDGATGDNRIIEVKTTGNPEDWINGPPVYYWLQASLYAYHLNANGIRFAVGVLSDEDRKNPYEWVLDGNVHTYDVGLYPGFEEMHEKAAEWYNEYIAQGRTPAPDLDNPKDRAIIEALKLEASTDAELIAKANEYANAQAETARYDLAKKTADALKDELMFIMRAKNVGEVGGYKVTETEREVVDTDALKRDGLYNKYLKQTKTVSLRKARN